jgi:hypothetical protein
VYLECAYISVLEEYKGKRKAGHTMQILHILHILIFTSITAWVDQRQSAIVYERRGQAQVLYAIPVSSVLVAFLLFQSAQPGQYPLP